MPSGPAIGRLPRAVFPRLAAGCLILTAALPDSAAAQTLTGDLFRPVRGGFVNDRDRPLRRTDEQALQPLPTPGTSTALPSEPPPANDQPAPSRIGRTPTYDVPAASGAKISGYDSLNRKRQTPKRYPGAARPPRAPGPGSPVPLAPTLPSPTAPPSSTAHKTPIPPAMAGTVPGQPQRRRLKIDDDPFGAVGDYAGSFLIKGAIETGGGYDTNPGRVSTGKGSAFYTIAPELLIVSDWERHALVADLRGSYTGYAERNLGNSGVPGVSSAPVELDRPEFNGHVDGRLDVTRDTRLLGQARLRVSTDNPGSPNVQAGLQRYPVYAAFGTTLGLDQSFNRLQLSGGATIDRTVYQESRLTDGTLSSNDDRAFNQYGGVGRLSYELTPAFKPFVEVEGDTRIRDIEIDRTGYRRDSNGGYVRGGTTFELTRLLTGEASIGYAARTYSDPRLQKLDGLLTAGSLIWTVNGLTTAKFSAATSLDETTLAGASGVLSRTYTVEVDHDFRRWLTGIGRFTYGTFDYQGADRADKYYSLSGDLVWKLTRSFWVKGQVRRDWLESNVAGASNQATVVMLGVRLQN